MFVSVERMVRVAAGAACACVVAMLAIYLTTGVGQDPLQFVHPSAAYAQLLLRGPSALRATIGLDNLFVVFYATVFLGLGVLLVRRGAPRALVLTATGLLLGLSLLDFVENFHFLAMLGRAELGLLPSDAEIELQVIESLLKFHVSYLGLFLIGFALPRSERLLANLSWFVQLPVGVAIYVAPPALATPLVLVRFAYFVTALVLVAARFGSESPAAASDSGVRASFPNTRPGRAA